MAIFRGTGSASATTDQTTIDTTTQNVVDAEAAQAAAEAAQAAAETAKTNAENLYGDLAAVNTAKTAAETAATNAATSETNAATSETNAATSATNAETSYQNTLTAFLGFENNYLGAKASDPTLNNQGEALEVGALYFNTTDDVLRTYDGTQWFTAVASLTDALINSNNLSDLTDAATARTNLGLGTAATTSSTDYATAAQGTKADTAHGWGDHSTAGYLTTVAIDGVSDVTITTPADNEVLAYDSTSGTWINQTATEAGLLTAEVNDLTAAVTWANVPDANITQTSVTQHQAALSITEGQISNLGADIVLDSDIGVTVQAYDADTAKTDTAQTFTASQRGTVTTDNDLSFDMNVTNFFKCTPAANGTLTFTNITAGQSGNIWLDNSGGYTISAASSTYIASADLTTISTAGVYFISYYSDGTNVMVSATPAVTSAGA